ncbi:MAG: CHAT domain-containing protein [Synechococcales bacterium]|nr:CHAT domain-containing protein [Synechococcales bacterium]
MRYLPPGQSKQRRPARQVRRWLQFIGLGFLAALVGIGILPAAPWAITQPPPTTERPSPAQADSTAAALEQQGQAFFQTGRYSEAAQAFAQAAQRYQRQENPVQQAIALSNQALAHQQIGEWEAANRAIAASLSILEQQGNGERASQWGRSQARDIQGHLLLAQGNAEAAIDAWETASQLFQALGHPDRAMESQVNQAQALQTLGLHRRAAKLLAQLLQLDLTVEDLSPTNLSAQWAHLPQMSATLPALQSLGEVLRIIGNLSLARQVLEHSLAMAQQTQQGEAIAAIQLSLANLTRTEAYVALSATTLTPSQAVALMQQQERGDRRRGVQDAAAFYTAMDRALDLYRQTTVATRSPLLMVRGELNQLRVFIELDRQAAATALAQQIQPQLDQLPPGRDAIYARINLAQSLMRLENSATSPTAEWPSHWLVAAQLLSAAVQQAKALGDMRAESYALGNLGHLYEQAQQFLEAQQVTTQALLLAQTHQAPDIAYRWQWQLGRLLLAQAKAVRPADAGRSRQLRTEAIAAYQEAVGTLQSIRSDLVAITPEEQFSFRDTIEPIYRQLVDLLLSPSNQADAATLKAARDVVESLQLAELDNFFRQACLTAEPSFVDEIDGTAAVFYPVVLPDRLAVIVSLPTGSTAGSNTSTLQAFTLPIPRSEVETTVKLLRDALDQPNDSRYLAPAQQLYNWLIRPVESQLRPSQVETLVFVLDDVLRDVPLAALHDGQHYLVEQPFSIALTPGLQLLEPLSANPRRSQAALLAGITEARSGFLALPNVRRELRKIQSVFPRTTTLLDDTRSRRRDNLAIDGAFTRENFLAALRDRAFPIVHLATHGQFSSQANHTFVLTQDGRLGIEDLKGLLESTTLRPGVPLDLLVFSACETASGDRRAALGLAGMATRAGAQSTIATLWNVNDASSARFMGQLYQALGAGQMTKAQAFHQAQLALLHSPDYQHPYFWAAYVLLGRWQ